MQQTGSAHRKGNKEKKKAKFARLPPDKKTELNKVCLLPFWRGGSKIIRRLIHRLI